ncbi:MAG TPA: hypothetical protein DCX10_14680 [Verrucomicrobiales bacterium]|nr:hypothetical protein [Verrucomicrobiales bacterium]
MLGRSSAACRLMALTKNKWQINRRSMGESSRKIPINQSGMGMEIFHVGLIPDHQTSGRRYSSDKAGCR